MMPKDKLIAEVALSRNAITRDFTTVCSELNVVSKVRQSVKRTPFAWLGGAAAIGYVLAGPKRRTKVVTKTVRDKSEKAKPAKSEKSEPRSFFAVLFSLFKILVPLVRPALSAYAARRFGDFAEKLGK